MSGRGGRRPGAGMPRRLSDWEADELRLMRRRGATLREIADRFRLSERTATRYLRDYAERGRK